MNEVLLQFEVTRMTENELIFTRRCVLKPAWTDRYPNRFYNEDNQRQYEEIAFEAISEVLMYRARQKCGLRDPGYES